MLETGGKQLNPENLKISQENAEIQKIVLEKFPKETGKEQQ